jgi:hypothetical protein
MLQRISRTDGLYQCTGDKGTYTNQKGSLFIGTHVYDLLGITPTDEELNKVEVETEKQVEVEKRGRPSKMVGMELIRSKLKDQVLLTQTLVIESMMKTYIPAEEASARVKHITISISSTSQTGQSQKPKNQRHRFSIT